MEFGLPWNVLKFLIQKTTGGQALFLFSWLGHDFSWATAFTEGPGNAYLCIFFSCDWTIFVWLGNMFHGISCDFTIKKVSSHLFNNSKNKGGQAWFFRPCVKQTTGGVLPSRPHRIAQLLALLGSPCFPRTGDQVIFYRKSPHTNFRVTAGDLKMQVNVPKDGLSDAILNPSAAHLSELGIKIQHATTWTPESTPRLSLRSKS